MTPPVVLTIAGSDSGGGAGIQADLRTFAAHRVFATTAITAVTVQNSVEVRALFPIPPECVVAQAEAVLDDLPVSCVKTGMLASAATISAVAEFLRERGVGSLVVDPVLVASTGRRLLDEDAVGAYVELLVPLATVVTPNLYEAGVLVGGDVRTLPDQRAAARDLVARGARWAVVKGGHATEDGDGEAIDVVSNGDETLELRAPRIATHNTHGSGCSFASAIAANLALGMDPRTAIRAAKSFVHEAIVGSAGWRLGAGHGPLDHFFPSVHTPMGLVSTQQEATP